MSSFTAPLLVEIEQGERGGLGLARLTAPFVYGVGAEESADRIEVAAGFVTDFASVPWFARSLFAPFDRAAKAAVVHDFLLEQQPRARPRAEIDRIFREALAVLKVAFWRRWVMWAAVRLHALWRGDR
jgi:hypothetical protein